MALSINTNTTALAPRTGANKINDALNQSVQRVSTGLKINSAKDDAAGLSIANGFTSQISQQRQGINNLLAGTSLVQTAEGGLGSITDALQRMRELAIQSSNGTNSASDRRALQNEFAQLQQDIGSVVDNTTFNNTKVLSESQNLTITVDGNGEAIGVNLLNVREGAGATQVLSEVDISTADGANQAIASIDDALSEVGSIRSDFGAVQNRLEFATRAAESAEIAAASARSQISDADIASELANNIKSQILSQANIAIQSQANAQPKLVLQLLSSK